MGAPRVRRSLTDLQAEYDSGNREPLETLVRAWRDLQALPAEDPRSFFTLGGYHGEPFRGAGWGVGSGLFWGGYCQHGNVLFPLWHRVYLVKLEQALRSVSGHDELTMPFWDECSGQSLAHGIPSVLTDESFELPGEGPIRNPLRSFVLPRTVGDFVAGDDQLYTKPAGYATVRYPYSGLVGTPAAAAQTKAHNARWTPSEALAELNGNIVRWLNQKVVIGGQIQTIGIHRSYVNCLAAPNYTVFSNTSSRDEWNLNNPHAMPLESPHNAMHLAIGGCDVPGQHSSLISGANGDMGENNTAALDPIFYFHHCFVDLVFWAWQRRHGAVDALEIIEGFPGTNSVDGQGATPGVPPNSWLSLDSPLAPFARDDGGLWTGRDAIDIEGQLGYTYARSSVDEMAPPDAPSPSPTIQVTGINRGAIRGSFLVVAFADVDGQRSLIGTEAVLSRWRVDGCANCQTHLAAGASFPLLGLDPDTVHVEVHTRDGVLGGGRLDEGVLGGVPAGADRPVGSATEHFHVEVSDAAGSASGSLRAGAG